MATRRRSNREGSIWQRQDGRWTGAAYVLTTDGTSRRTYVYGRTREQVHSRLVELQGRSARGIPRADRVWKVGEFLDYWLENIARPAARPTTYAKYETITRLYLRPGLGRYRLDRMSVAVVQSWLNSRLAAVDSIAKVHVMRTVLGAALTRAMREELVSRNVARLVTLPPNRPARQQPWSPAEVRAFLQAARGDRLYPAFVLLLVYGVRRGEVLGLSWHDVDLGARCRPHSPAAAAGQGPTSAWSGQDQRWPSRPAVARGSAQRAAPPCRAEGPRLRVARVDRPRSGLHHSHRPSGRTPESRTVLPSRHRVPWPAPDPAA